MMHSSAESAVDGGKGQHQDLDRTIALINTNISFSNSISISKPVCQSSGLRSNEVT